jgi:hypothetical protein
MRRRGERACAWWVSDSRIVPSNGLTVLQDASPGDWIAPRFEGAEGTVTSTVPGGYEAYVRVCHPAYAVDGTPVGWAEVASATGRTAHPLMQWHALVGSADALNFRGSLWPGGSPERGNLAKPVLQELCDLLAGHTADRGRCFAGIWVGWGWVDGTLVDLDADLRGPRLSRPWTAEQHRRRAKLLWHPFGREYVVVSGPLSAMPMLAEPDAWGDVWPQSPNLLWPADRTWCLASEIDFDSTLVGGSAGLIEALLAATRLDSWRVAPGDSLAYDADLVNEVPGVAR